MLSGIVVVTVRCRLFTIEVVVISGHKCSHDVCRHISGPHICGEGLDIDGTYDHLLTASWRKENVLQVWDLPTGRLIKDIPQDVNRRSLVHTLTLY